MFMLNEKYKDSLQDVPTILPLTPTSTPRRAEEYRGNLVDVMSNPDWHKPDAVIGRPLQSPANCWLTSGQFKPLSDGPRYETDLATQTRDELGLVNLVKGQLLLRLTISAGCLAAIEGNESARPIFCDGGNSRFRVHDPSEPAAVYATDGWGATFHLGKFAVGATDNMTGRSERVFTSLPLEHLPALKVELLGEIGETPERPANCKDDDEEFFKALLAGRTESDINERLTEFLREL